jgi:DeoR/GlpR family transcriptional regulator of sugar metabolism
LNWFEAQRIQWIGEMLDVYGFINRQHLMRKFGVSEPQASKDLHRFQRLYPARIAYNLHTKRYEVTQ